MLSLDSRIDPGKSIAYTQRQPKFPQLNGKLPCRILSCGKSAAGKGVVLQNLMTRFFVDKSERPCFDRYLICSPTSKVDHSAWKPVREFMEKRMGLSPEKINGLFFDKWEPDKIEAEIAAHSKIVAQEKRDGKTVLSALLCVFDDMADQGNVVHKNNDSLINRLYLSGRHHGISSIVVTQKLRLIAPAVRVNCSWAMFFRTADRDEWDAMFSMFSALVDRATFDQIWEHIHQQPYSFLSVFFHSQDPNRTFMERLEKWIDFSEEDEDNTEP